jgi:hypothetical protein
MGTAGKTASLGDIDRTPGKQQVVALRTMARCEYTAPLGCPVVPEV